ncbi:hypothetical protein Tco_1370555 [Tanacetum coccineum]
MSKVLQERGFESLSSSTKTNLRDQVKSISTTIEADASSIRLGELAHIKLTIELADRIVKYPKGIAENVLVDFAVLEDMDAYRDEGMGDVIFGEPFLREVGINAKRSKE